MASSLNVDSNSLPANSLVSNSSSGLPDISNIASSAEYDYKSDHSLDSDTIEGFGQEVILTLLVYIVWLSFPVIRNVYHHFYNTDNVVVNDDTGAPTTSNSYDRISTTDGGQPTILTSHDMLSRRVDQRRNNHDLCPICYENPPKFAIETNCAHIYCGACLFSYIEKSESSMFRAILCPYCRQRLTLLLTCFSEEERSGDALPSEEMNGRRELIDKILYFNRRYSGLPRTWREHIRDSPMLLRHLWRYTISSMVTLPFWVQIRLILSILCTLAYFVSPFDIIPELLFGLFGFIDDIIVLGLLLLFIVGKFREFVTARNDLHH